jgi:serine/threonine-protein kinase
MTEMPEYLHIYRLEAYLGRGGMGEVFLAWDDRLERHVAIKRIRHSDVSDDQRERFRREARATARLNHPAIVQIHDVFETEHSDCLVMEYVAGQTIRQRLRDGTIDSTLAVRLVRQIASGLVEAHSKGIVHRDLKPENVIVTDTGCAKICDFGLARALWKGVGSDDALTDAGAVIGTAGYMAPEQVLGSPVDHRSDLFSLGVLLYELLTRKAPFQGESPLDTMNRIAETNYVAIDQIAPSLPAPLTDLVNRLLARDPDCRPGNARLVERQLATLDPSEDDTTQLAVAVTVDAESPTIDGDSPLPTPGRVPRPAASPGSRWRLITAALAGMAAVLAGAGWLLREPVPARRVVVLTPEIRAAGDDRESLEKLASTALFGSLRGLGTLTGLAPIDPEQIADPQATRVEIARAVAADDAIASTVEAWGEKRYRITLQRIAGSTGETVWMGSFEAPTPTSNACRQIADTVAIYLQRAFPKHPLRPGVPLLEVSDKDYAAFIQIYQDSWFDGLASLERLAAIEELLKSSPRFFAAHVKAADLALILYRVDSRTKHIDCAISHIGQAMALSPSSPEPLFLSFNAELLGGHVEKAAATLEQLERLVPGDEELLWAKARLARAQGRPNEAIGALREAVKRYPTWRLLFRLAELEFQNGEIDAARRSLTSLLELVPNSFRGRFKLADLELLYGNPKDAERLYRELSTIQPSESLYNNLGLSQMLLGDIQAAITSFNEALRINPESRDATLNLADALYASGDSVAAAAGYSQIREALELTSQSSPLCADELIVLAQCLAHLNEHQQAVAVAQDALRSEPNNGEIQLLAALVFSLAGERLSALACIKKSLDLGVQRRWFTAPYFESLQNDPEFLKLLTQAATGTS